MVLVACTGPPWHWALRRERSKPGPPGGRPLPSGGAGLRGGVAKPALIGRGPGGRCHSSETMRPLLWPLPALLLALAARGTAASAPTYPRRDAETGEWLACDKCPPGTFVQRPCDRDNPTTCGACPPRHYTQFWNYLERCRYCNVICGEREEEARPCGATHNRACRCRPGFFAHAGFCLEHEPCPPGAGVVAPGGCRAGPRRRALRRTEPTRLS